MSRSSLNFSPLGYQFLLIIELRVLLSFFFLIIVSICSTFLENLSGKSELSKYQKILGPSGEGKINFEVNISCWSSPLLTTKLEVLGWVWWCWFLFSHLAMNGDDKAQSFVS